MTATRAPLDHRLLRHARSSRSGVATLALLGAGQAVATVTMAVALTDLVVSFAARTAPGWPALAALAATFAARAVLTWAEQVVAQRTAARVTDELRRGVLAAALRRGPAWAARYGTGRLTAVLGGGLDALRPWFTGYLPSLALGVALPPLVVAAMLAVDPGSAVVTLLTLPLVPVFGILIGRATQRRAEQRWAADARLAGHFLDVVHGLATLRLFDRAERQVSVVAQMTDRHRAATVRVLRVAFLSSTALDLVGTLSVGLVAVEAGVRVAAGDLGLGPALLVILLAPEAYRPLREVAARYHAGTAAGAVIGDVDEVLSGLTTARPVSSELTTRRPQRPRATTGNAEVAGHPVTGHPVTGHPVTGAEHEAEPSVDQGAVPGVVASGVRVRHPDRPVDALVLPRLRVRGGELVALAGASGAGKTTALRVLAGRQPVQAGTVEVTGPPPLYLPQRPTLPHSRTLAEALALDGEARPPEAAAFAALRAVGLATEIAQGADGLEARLGEHGQGLSSGQRRRLALARLLRQARTGPVVLLLDEPTANLDPATERLVIAELRAAAARGCAVLVVAHRPAVLAAADRVVTIRQPTATHRTCRATAPSGAAAQHADAVADRAPAPTRTAGPDRPCRAAEQPVAPVVAVWRASDPAPAAAVAPPHTTRPDRPRRSRTARMATALLRLRGTPVTLGGASWLAGVALTAAAGWLLTRASSLPPVLTLSTAVVVVRGAAVARPLLRYLERLASHEVAFTRLVRWRSRVYADLIPRLPGPGLGRRGELLTRVVDDVDARVDGLLRGGLPATAAVLTLGLGLCAAAVLVPGTGVVLAAALAVVAVLAPAVAVRHASRLDAAADRARAELRDAMVETVDGLEELGTRDASAALAVPDRRSRALSQIEARAARTAGAAAALAHLGWGVAVVGPAVLRGDSTGPASSDTVIAPETAALLLLGIVALTEPALALPDAAVARRRAVAARDRLAAVGRRQPIGPKPASPRRIGPKPASPKPIGPNPASPKPIGPNPASPNSASPNPAGPNPAGPKPAGPNPAGPEPASPEPAGSEPVAGGGGRPTTDLAVGGSAAAGVTADGTRLKARGLVAGWDPGRPPALAGLDLDVPAGARVAVLGASGSGKSTLAAVLVGLLAPRAGSVSVGGGDLRALPTGAVHRRVCLVGDAVDHVFASTVRENLRLAHPAATDAELTDALARVRLQDWLTDLPHGLDTWLGAGATTVSGGQRRRLATARALLAGPDVLVLDEPTEGLDPETASELMTDLMSAAAGRTVLLLTHRREGLDQADEIHEIVDGVLRPAQPTRAAL